MHGFWGSGSRKKRMIISYLLFVICCLFAFVPVWRPCGNCATSAITASGQHNVSGKAQVWFSKTLPGSERGKLNMTVFVFWGMEICKGSAVHKRSVQRDVTVLLKWPLSVSLFLPFGQSATNSAAAAAVAAPHNQTEGCTLIHTAFPSHASFFIFIFFKRESLSTSHFQVTTPHPLPPAGSQPQDSWTFLVTLPSK